VAEEKVHPEAAHTVFQLVDLAIDKGKVKLDAVILDPDAPYTFSGVVPWLNYALDAEVNGAVLDSGDFLHLKAEGAKALQLIERSKVKGVGKTRTMAGGRLVIEADQVNGMPIKHKPKGKKTPANKHAWPFDKHR
jgi:hypothetical protein